MEIINRQQALFLRQGTTAEEVCLGQISCFAHSFPTLSPVWLPASELSRGTSGYSFVLEYFGLWVSCQAVEGSAHTHLPSSWHIVGSLRKFPKVNSLTGGIPVLPQLHSQPNNHESTKPTFLNGGSREDPEEEPL